MFFLSFIMVTIAFFDSGVGGLSVWREVNLLNPEARYVYAFDNRYFPYGNLEGEVVIDRCRRVLSRIMDQFPVDLVVIACNTASTIVLPVLRSQLNIPVVGVVPAIKPAANLSKNKVIGLIATPATVKRPYIDDLINQYASDCRVIRFGNSELVRLAENKMITGESDRKVVEDILEPLTREHGMDTVVLGCTHFPWIREEIQSVLPECKLCIDSGKAIARRVKSILGTKVSADLTENSAVMDNQAFMTDSSVAQYKNYCRLFKSFGFSGLNLLSV